jgi:prophage DNA circulation protein
MANITKDLEEEIAFLRKMVSELTQEVVRLRAVERQTIPIMDKYQYPLIYPSPVWSITHTNTSNGISISCPGNAFTSGSGDVVISSPNTVSNAFTI